MTPVQPSCSRPPPLSPLSAYPVLLPLLPPPSGCTPLPERTQLQWMNRQQDRSRSGAALQSAGAVFALRLGSEEMKHSNATCGMVQRVAMTPCQR